MPGYAGHRPQSKTVVAKAAIGGVAFRTDVDALPGQGTNLHNRPTTTFQSFLKNGAGERVVHEKPSRTDEFKRAIGGVKLGYTGHVPQARSHFETPDHGGCDGPDKGGQVRTRTTTWGDRVLAPTDVQEGLRVPSMLHKQDSIEGDPLGYSPPPKQVFRRGISPTSREFGHGEYGGHRPRDHARALTGKIGTPLSTAPNAAGQAAWRNTGPSCHNDWLQHQATPPTDLPSSTRGYLDEVGGIMAHYAGFVPRSEQHCASTHRGMRLQQAKSLAQRGHEGKNSASCFRIPAQKGASQLAESSAIHYAGHRPSACHGVGVGYWKNEASLGGARVEADPLYSA